MMDDSESRITSLFGQVVEVAVAKQAAEDCAQVLAALFHSLIANGLTREEALSLCQWWISTVGSHKT